MPDMNMQTYEELQRHQLVTEFDIQSQSELEDYQVQLENVDNPTQALDNLIIGIDGEILPHWNESIDFDTWVKMNIGPSGKRGLLIHGNGGLSSGSSITGIFIQGDDFEWGNDGDPITDNGGGITWSIGGGNVDISTTHSKSGTRSMKLVSNNPRSISAFPQNTGEDYIIRCSIYKPDVTEFYLLHDDASTQIYKIFYGNDNLGYYDTAYRDSGYDGQENEWAVIEIRDIDWSANTYDIYWKDSLLDQIVKEATPMRAISQNNNKVVFNVNANQDVWIDNVVIRKYAETEPIVQINTPKNISTALKSFGRAG